MESRGHVLVVDDQDNWRLALKVLLESEGLQVSQASGFEEAEIALTETSFDVVVLDVRLVDEDILNVDGLELLRLIETDHPSTHTVILTGYPESIKKDPEADALILKAPEGRPFDSAEFKKEIKKLVTNSP